jgi:hydrogenase maturation protease
MILAFALGNPIRRDDGAGAAIAAGLDALVPGLEDLEVVEALELLPEHAEAAAAAEGVLFLDAAAGGTPGEVRCAPVEPRAARAALVHALLPEELLGLARALHGRAPPAVLVTIAGADFSFGEGLSPAVAAALPAARERARDAASSFPPAPPDGV